MAQSYVVKSGDTLNKIAKSYGVSLSDISGYKSGDPNKIYSGETIQINDPVTTKTDTSADQYANDVKSALNTGDTSTTKDTSTDDYLTTLQTKISEAQSTVNNAAEKLANLKTTTYDKAYSDAGLDTIKTNISTLDDEILSKKTARDEAVAKVKNNPGLSAALMTGTVKKLSDQANNEINNLISERNTLASDYNTGLTKVNQVVTNTVGDAENIYNAAVTALKNMTTQASDYQKNLLDVLKESNDKTYQDKELEIALMNANTNAKKAESSTDTNWKLAISPITGKPVYWYNAAGETKPLSEADVANAAISTGTTEDTTTNEEDTTDNGNWFTRLFSSLFSK